MELLLPPSHDQARPQARDVDCQGARTCHVQCIPEASGSERSTALLCCRCLICHPSTQGEIKISFREGLEQLLLQGLKKETLKRQEDS